ncbi:MAG: nucleoside phosphorylase [Desulfobacca sp.]|uniref:nucleoside phosphorylase n=1 Tax=Desulfobacca sp. TaxID=2067990 RepID=UPI00404B1919
MTLPVSADGTLAYHLQTRPGDLAPYILTSGAPERIRRLAGLLDKIQFERQHREFLTITGIYQGIPVSGLATGIGAPPTAIAIIEAVQCQPQATFIRLGSCGSLQPQIQLGDLVISSKALRHDGVTQYYAPPEVEATADPEVTAALQDAARQLGVVSHTGLTRTAADFYHAQGRPAPGFHGVDPSLLSRLQAQGVLSQEMEMAVYLTLARVCQHPIRAGGCAVVFADRYREVFIDPVAMAAAEDLICRVGLLAVTLMATAANPSSASPTDYPDRKGKNLLAAKGCGP